MKLLGKNKTNNTQAKPSGKAAKQLEVVSPNITKFEKGMVSLTDVIAPSSIEVDFHFIRIGEKFYKTIFVVGYPRYVSPNWLQPLIDFDHSMNISMFIYPTSSPDVLSDLRRKIAEMEATISSQVEEGQLIDPKVKAALDDALSVQEELAKGVERFFQFSLYITVSAETVKDLDEASKRLSTTLSSILMLSKTPLYRWKTASNQASLWGKTGCLSPATWIRPPWPRLFPLPRRCWPRTRASCTASTSKTAH